MFEWIYKVAMNKLCNKCEIVKPVDEFHRKNTKPIGHQSICKDCKGKAVKDWARRNPEKVKARNDKFNMLNREKRRQLYYRHKRELLIHYGNGECSCVQCGEDRLPCLTIDHINGCGGEERKRIGNGFLFYRWLKNKGYPIGYQTLCMNCQLVKRHEKDENAKPRGAQSSYPFGFNKELQEKRRVFLSSMWYARNRKRQKINTPSH